MLPGVTTVVEELLLLLGVVTVVDELVPGVTVVELLPSGLVTVVDESGVDGVVTVVDEDAPSLVFVTVVDESALARDAEHSNAIAKNVLKLKAFIRYPPITMLILYYTMNFPV